MRTAPLLIMLCASIGSMAASLDERLAPCLACHGEQGQSSNPEVPSLGAQRAPYVLIQLYLFRDRQRVVELMNEMAKDLSDDDLRTFSDAIAKLPAPKPVTEPMDAKKLAKGKELVQQYRCNYCHSEDLSGADNVPRIAGQREDYLLKTLREYKSNVRRGYDGSMAEVLQPVPDGDIVDLAYYVARQP
jgi:cytochrome c553